MASSSTLETKIPNIFKSILGNVSGMDDLKIALSNMYNMQQVNRKRFSLGLGSTGNQYKNNMLIVGPKGSGKTTAAMLVGECYEKLGIASDKKLIVTDYQKLLSTSAAETAQNLKTLLESAKDRIILIDNVEEFDDNVAYSPGFEMLDKIVEAYYASGESITIIATGEEKAVKELLNKKRNFAELFDIPMVALGDYSDDDLKAIVHRIAKELGYILDDGAENVLIRAYKSKKESSDFNYLILFKEMIVKASMNAASRVAGIRHASDLDVSLIKAEDFDDSKYDESAEETLEELIDKLNSLIGLLGVKEEVNTMIASVKMAKLEEKAGISTSNGAMHMVFLGAPGTGKTTVARLLGKIYAKLGVLSKGQLVECSRKDLVAEHVGGTAKQTHAKVEEALGGVLFIDEAYSVCRDKYDVYGLEAIDTLTADIYNYKDDLLVVLAGYEKEMENFMSQNPGMKSRVPHTIHFENYSVDDLMRIFTKYVDDSGMFLNPDAEEELQSLLKEKSKSADFGNARGVENLFNEVVRNHKKRLAEIDENYISINDIRILRREDFKLSDVTSKGDNSLLEWYEELDSLTGLYSVKEQIKQMASKVKVNQVRKERGLPTQDMPSLHLVFKGNAGTGKTTVARLIGHIYKDLGVLSTDRLVECTRSDVVGEFQGQTAQKMKAKIKEAQGGILFIDEVYSLCNGPHDSYGMEAINELVPAMENYRDNFMVIAAGYTDAMDDFMLSNRGLRSRFSRELYFEDFSKDELIEIFMGMLDERALILSSKSDVPGIIDNLMFTCSKNSSFGNARGVRNLVDKLSQIQECRIAVLLETDENVSNDEIQQVTKADLEALIHSL